MYKSFVMPINSGSHDNQDKKSHALVSPSIEKSTNVNRMNERNEWYRLSNQYTSNIELQLQLQLT